jgi:hypothetical protein
MMVANFADVVCILYLIAAPPGDMNPETVRARELENRQAEIRNQ